MHDASGLAIMFLCDRPLKRLAISVHVQMSRVYTPWNKSLIVLLFPFRSQKVPRLDSLSLYVSVIALLSWLLHSCNFKDSISLQEAMRYTKRF